MMIRKAELKRALKAELLAHRDTSIRAAELEAALTEALALAESMEFALDQEFGVTGDPPSRDRKEIERLSLVLKGRHAEEAQA